MINETLCSIVTDQLETWRIGFLSSNPINELLHSGVLEITDQLDGISDKGYDCYATFLFNKLTEFDKEFILQEIDFDVNFDELCATYYLD